MGLFDSIHLDGVIWQTKALGKNLRHYRPGDEVRVQRVPDDGTGSSLSYEELPEKYLVEVYATEYLLVEDGKVKRLATEEEMSEMLLDTFDSRGRDQHDEMAYLFGDEMAHVFGEQRPKRKLVPRPDDVEQRNADEAHSDD